MSKLPSGVAMYNDKFRARIFLKGKLVHLGSFDTSAEASEAYHLGCKRRKEGIEFHDYKSLMFRTIHNFNKWNNIDEDDYASLGMEVFLKCLNSFDSDRGAFGSYYRLKLRSYFAAKLKAESEHHSNRSELSESQWNAIAESCGDNTIIDDIIHRACLTKREGLILQEFRDGYTDSETASRWSITRQRAHQMRVKLIKRLKMVSRYNDLMFTRRHHESV